MIKLKVSYMLSLIDYNDKDAYTTINAAWYYKKSHFL